MTRVMFWNIDNFGTERFFSERQKKPTGWKRKGGKTPAQAALDRLTVVTSVVQEVAPDVLVVVEVTTGQNGLSEGEVVNEGAAQSLLWRLRELGIGNYALVPPLISGTGGRAEGVAVFYDSDKLHFLGPWGWPGGNGPADEVGNLPGLGNYPAAWYVDDSDDNALPHRQLPVDAPLNAGLWEDQLAGQWRFTGPGPAYTELRFPGAGNRRPYHTAFWEQNGARRVIRVTGFHAPPNQLPAAGSEASSIAGTKALAAVREIKGAIPAGEVWCVMGDYNVSLFSSKADQAYKPIRDMGMAQAIARGALPNAFPEKGYLITHLRRAEANPWDTNGYPGFGYVSVKEKEGTWDAIDNAFTRFGATAGGPATGVTILNPVIGSPYTAVNPAPNGAPEGTVALTSRMSNPGSLPVPGGVPENTRGALKHFTGWEQFGKIRSTSDHMPITFDL